MQFLVMTLLLLITAHGSELSKSLSMPKNFKIIQTLEVKGARQMALGPNGVLYVGTMDQGVVYEISSENKLRTVFSNLNYPQGVLLENGELYVAELHRISKTKDFKSLVKLRDFPNEKWHGWKTIQKGPDGKLYVPQGAPCNVCEKQLPYSALLRMNFDGTQLESVALGIRNTVGYTWHPETKELWFTEMGRDMMGDDLPPDEINVIRSERPHFGFPYIHAKGIKDPEFGAKLPTNLKTTEPEYEVPAHSAPIGIAFFPKDKYPKEFHDCFLVAEHGSWNRSKKIGYQVTKGCLKDGKIVSYVPFITGFKKDEQALGRPVHILFLEDGSFYLSEDEPGTIFKIRYSP